MLKARKCSWTAGQLNSSVSGELCWGGPARKNIHRLQGWPENSIYPVIDRLLMDKKVLFNTGKFCTERYVSWCSSWYNPKGDLCLILETWVIWLLGKRVSQNTIKSQILSINTKKYISNLNKKPKNRVIFFFRICYNVSATVFWGNTLPPAQYYPWNPFFLLFNKVTAPTWVSVVILFNIIVLLKIDLIL